MDKQQLRKLVRDIEMEENPDKVIVEEIVRTNDELAKLNQSLDGVSFVGLESLKGDKGDSIKGDKGDKGDKGEKGDTGDKGNDGLDGLDGMNGKDGSPDTAEEIVTKLNTLEGVVDFKVLKGVPEVFSPIEARLIDLEKKSNAPSPKGKIDQRWHGGGLSTISHDDTLTGTGTPSDPLHANQLVTAGSNVTVTGTGSIADPYIVSSNGAGGGAWQAPETPVGDIDGINDTYTISYSPNTYSGIITINGKVYDELTDWTISGDTITFINILDTSLSTATFKFKGQL